MNDRISADLLGAAGDVPSLAQVEFSIVVPCLNEATTLGACVQKAVRSIGSACIAGEVIVADNGSADGSQAIAVRNGARVVPVEHKGYGSALMGGIASARGRYVIMGDADDSYDFAELGGLIDKLREGFELVMGNRFAGQFMPGAMPALHRYVGNPVLSGIGRLLFHNPCHDFHCGLRGFDREAILALDLRCDGMEFASEMVVRAALAGMRIAEVPVTLWPDGRIGRPHLRPWRDGMRHLSFLLGAYVSSRRQRVPGSRGHLLGGSHATPFTPRPLPRHNVA